jgi:hypothetical protein
MWSAGAHLIALRPDTGNFGTAAGATARVGEIVACDDIAKALD